MNSEASASSPIEDVDYNSLPSESPQSTIDASEDPSLFSKISAATKKQQELDNMRAPNQPSITPRINAIPQSLPPLEQEIAPQDKPLSAPLFQATLDPYGAELNDDALKQAYADKRRGDQYAAMLKAGSLIGSGISGAVSGGKGPSSDVDTSAIEKLAASKLEEIQGRRVGKKDEISFDKARTELGDTNALSDPSSSISKLTGKMLKNLGLNIPEGISAAQLKASGIDVDRMMNAREMAEQRKEASRISREERALSREGLIQQRNIQNIEKLQQNYNKDKVVATANEGISAANMAESLLDSDTPIADAAIKRQLARLAGEVGVMTDQDVASFGGSQAVKDRLAQSVKTMSDGKLTKANKEFMRQVISVMRKRREDQLKDRAEFYSKQGSKRLGISLEEAMDNILPGHDTMIDKQKQSPPSSSGMVKVKEIATGKTGSIPADKLEKALNSGKFERI